MRPFSYRPKTGLGRSVSGSAILLAILAISLVIIAGAAPEWVRASDADINVARNQSSGHGATIPGDANGFITDEQNADAPYIVANGVKMHEVSHSEAGGWKVRAASDDTYGNGELIVVAVEFSEPVRADSDTTFRIRIGSVNRDLAPVGTRGNRVLFGTLIRSQDRDSDGIWIGDSTQTLDHNDADSIRSAGASPVNANSTHSRLGTQAGHKVNGAATRPRLQAVSISSTPQHADYYVRGETILVSARFDRSVVVSGDVSARLNITALQAVASRDADYSEGSGTTTLVFDHVVTPFENDPKGVVIPANALAESGDLAQGPLGGGSIVGRRGGLVADLASSKRGPLNRHRVDARYAAAPEVMASALFHWDENTPVSHSLTMDFSIREDPGHFSETDALVLALAWGIIGDVRFAVGLRTDLDKPGTDGSQGKGIVFNRWGTTDTSSFSRTTGDGWVETGDLAGPFISIRRTFDWNEGNYTLRIGRDGRDDVDGGWYGFWIRDQSTNVETHLGSMKFPMSADGRLEILARSHGIGSVMAVVGDGAVKPHEIPVFEAAVALPQASGGDPPTKATVTYSLLNGVMTNSNVRYEADTGKIVLRAGGETSRTTPAGDITGLETPKLTATPGMVPASHDGSSRFTFELTFSEDIPLSSRTLRNHAFTVHGGKVSAARRLERQSNIGWRIKVKPKIDGAVFITLPVPVYCGVTGAICTPDGRKLAREVLVKVPGSPSRN